jgi:(1->4)-alpha-D-glucan 1-alpha-D-glucosylmutase
MTAALKSIRAPLATYRLQLRSDFGFEATGALAPYLCKLGVSDLYLSPLFRAREQSAHGYDVVSHQVIEPAFGGELAFEHLAGQLRPLKMGLLLDVVPNHMGIDDAHNLWWQDVLENGEGARCARHFDIDWDPPTDKLKHRVLLPVLGDSFGKILEQQELQVAYADRRFYVQYYQRRFPLSPYTWPTVLRETLQRLPVETPPSDTDRLELESVIAQLENLPPPESRDAEHIHVRYREQEVAARRLQELLERSSSVHAALAGAIEELNGRAGVPHSFDKLDALLDAQPYRLSWWRAAMDEINYRRFFDINELAAIRVEEPEVFEAAHQMVFQLLCKGWVTGLRIDHPDGLYDPTQYFENLQKEWRRSGTDPNCAASNDANAPSELYVVVEKILAHDEDLRADWPVSGATGYGYLNTLNGLFVSRQGVEAITESYRRFTRLEDSFSDILYQSKRAVLNYSMSSELHMLAWRLNRLATRNRWSRDFTFSSLVRTLREVIACFPVYRTYVRPRDVTPSDEDIRRIMMAIRLAKLRNKAMSWAYFDFLASVLLLQEPAGASDGELAERREFVLKFQQVTGPVMAKGLEDTAFYRYYPLASLNEVGGEPSSLGVTIEEFHRQATRRRADWPTALSATSTHDAKRGEDMRARLNVLSEIPEAWNQAVRRWSLLNTPHRVEVDGSLAPDRNEEYLIYQTLLGAWPLDGAARQPAEDFVGRICAYMQKAMREAKVNTSWLNVSEGYEQAVVQFVRAILSPPQSSEFISDLDAFARRIADHGFFNSLAQTAIKICTPGVPDFYQGAELWEFSLVDPDNRRPVDFALRQEWLNELERRAAEDLSRLTGDILAAWPDPRVKLFLVWRALGLRSRMPDVFLEGDYIPLYLEGERSENLFAFARRKNDCWVLTITPRFTTRLGEGGLSAVQLGWEDVLLKLPVEAPSCFRCAFTGENIQLTQDEDGKGLPLHDIFRRFPVGLLESGFAP